MNWTAYQDETLRASLASGKTHAQIAEQLGRTRGACIGRANRLGIEVPGKPSKAWNAGLKTGPAPDIAKRAAFAEALAEIGTVAGAARTLGISRQRGDQFLAGIKAEIDGAQRAAGFESWCR